MRACTRSPSNPQTKARSGPCPVHRARSTARHRGTYGHVWTELKIGQRQHGTGAAHGGTRTGRLPRRRAGLAVGDSGAPGDRRGDMVGDGREGDTEQLARAQATLELRLLRRLLEGGFLDGDDGHCTACPDMLAAISPSHSFTRRRWARMSRRPVQRTRKVLQAPWASNDRKGTRAQCARLLVCAHSWPPSASLCVPSASLYKFLPPLLSSFRLGTACDKRRRRYKSEIVLQCSQVFLLSGASARDQGVGESDDARQGGAGGGFHHRRSRYHCGRRALLRSAALPCELTCIGQGAKTSTQYYWLAAAG